MLDQLQNVYLYGLHGKFFLIKIINKLIDLNRYPHDDILKSTFVKLKKNGATFPKKLTYFSSVDAKERKPLPYKPDIKMIPKVVKRALNYIVEKIYSLDKFKIEMSKLL